MGRGRTRPRRVHATFPGPRGLGNGGLICGMPRAGAIVAADPRKVDCQTCLVYVRRHPDQFGLAPVRACRVCGCTEDDCSGCVERTGEPCRWVEADLCSACVEG